MIATLIIIGLLIFFLWFYFSKLKLPKLRNVVFIDGTLGSGKSALSVTIAVRLYKKAIRLYKIKKALGTIFRNKKLINTEKPILYSNIALRKIEYTPLTKKLITRQNYRFAYKSIILMDEFSLIADQNMYGKQYAEICERMNEFFKLFRHETKGGYIIINSQSVSDLNYTLKSVLNDYLYIHHKTGRFFPFFCIYSVIERQYSRDNDGVIQTESGDVENNLKSLWCSKKYYKYYDTYCHSIFTDNLPIWKNPNLRTKQDSLKTEELITYKDMCFLYENIRKENKENVQEN